MSTGTKAVDNHDDVAKVITRDSGAPDVKCGEDGDRLESVMLSPPSTVFTKRDASTASLGFHSDVDKSSSNEETSEVPAKVDTVKQSSTTRQNEPADSMEMKTLLSLIDNGIDSPTPLPSTNEKSGTVSKTTSTTTFNNYDRRNRNNFNRPNNSNSRSFTSPHFHHIYENRSLQNHQASGDYQKNDDVITKGEAGNEERKVTLNQTLYVPVKKYPKYNFVGRILGPRGMTVKQLEKETECKIYVRGRASNVSFNPHTKMMRGGVLSNKASLSTISQCALTDEPLHVYIECFNYPSIAAEKMKYAVSVINDLLSPPIDGKDELKRQQLVDISLINGTYRPTSTLTKVYSRMAKSGSFTQNSFDPTSAPVTSEKNEKSNGSPKGSVYRIPQQKRTWHKPRGPDTSSEEYAKSVSSREFVTDIVSKTKQNARTISSPDADNIETPVICPGLLSPSTINESLKIANNLLQSYQNMSFVPIEDEPQAQLYPSQQLVPLMQMSPPSQQKQQHHQPHGFQMDFPFMPIHPPIPQMHPCTDFPPSNPNSYFFPNPNMVDFYPTAFYPPPPPFPVPCDSNSVYQMPGFVYMLPGYNVFDKVVPHRQ